MEGLHYDYRLLADACIFVRLCTTQCAHGYLFIRVMVNVGLGHGNIEIKMC